MNYNFNITSPTEHADHINGNGRDNFFLSVTTVKTLTDVQSSQTVKHWWV